MNEYEKIFEIEGEELEELRKKAKEEVEKAEHKWVQRGIWLVCKSCPNSHAIYIGHKIFCGVKNGKIILKEMSLTK